MIKIHFAMKILKRVNMVMGVRNEIGVTQGLRLALAFGHHGMCPLHGGVAGTCFRVRDSIRSNSHRIMV